MSALDVLKLTESLQQELRQDPALPLTGPAGVVFLNKVLPTLSSVPFSFSWEEHIGILKCLRHACAGSFSNAQLLTELRVPATVLHLITTSHASYLAEKEHAYANNDNHKHKYKYTSELSCSSLSSSNSLSPATAVEHAVRELEPSFSDTQFKQLFTLAVQVLANYTSCKPPSSSPSSPSDPPTPPCTLWSLTGIEGFSQLLHLAVSFNSQGGLSATFAALNNCLRVPPTQDLGVGEAVAVARTVAASRQLCCQMALSVVDLQFAEMASKEHGSGGQVHPNVEWFQILTLHFFKTNHMVTVLSAVQRSAAMLAATPGHKECFSVSMSHEEVIFLCALDTILSDADVQADVMQREESFASLRGVLLHVAALLLPSAHLTSARHPRVVPVDATSVAVDEKYAVYLSTLRPPAPPAPPPHASSPSSSPPQSSSSIDLETLTTPAASVCLSILAILAGICNSSLGGAIAVSSSSLSCSPDSTRATHGPTIGHVLQRDLLTAGVMNICCSFLTGLNKIKSDRSALLAGQKKADLAPVEGSEYASEVARLCLQVVMNMTYRCKEAQDYCRVIGGFTSILSYCATDFDSPLSREWALMCVRNLCEGNEENQAFVSSMQLKGVLKDEQLAAQGISVEVDPSRGKFSFSQTAPPPPPSGGAGAAAGGGGGGVGVGQD